MTGANTPLSTSDYVAILKCKQSELGAAESCSLPNLVPLFEVTSPDQSSTKICKAWPYSKGVVWLHCLNLNSDDEYQFADAIDAMFAAIRAYAKAVPVVSPGEPRPTLTAVREIVETDQRGLVLRIDVGDLVNPDSNVHNNIDATLSECGVTWSDVDLVLDAGLEEGRPSVRAALVGQAIRSLPSTTEWRSTVVALSAFPQQLSSLVKADSLGKLSRDDAAAFSMIKNAHQDGTLSFADYTIGNPVYADTPFAPIPNIRYTADESWLVHRASKRNDRAPQYRQLASDLASAAHFFGNRFSPGDQYIQDVANGHAGPGNPMTWLRAGISHHLHVVAHRLANLDVP